ncbi:twin-arginine translocase subunit TatC [Desulfotomaculum copahuensis]|uniref:Sec-independent protein translocase protein TatC n=1 Tax=Desulfotomaculum copahuensis TaxID=1838280 RepID=A0A1B7LBZ0_9FIRM|nr:twin-arginine translocase subunit TatC [Desulfotomaculum copahuensis]OAT80256.1 twin arginine-targeting protein translocase TatC [Desulfotomaculum copahuensis]
MFKKAGEMTTLAHLEELRRVLIISIVTTFVLAAACWIFSDRVMAVLLQPVTATGHKVIYIGITEALFTKIKLSFFLGFLAALPVILWQVWGFVMPALRRREKFYFTVFVFVSYLLFIAGVAFSFLFVFKLGVQFLLRFGGPELLPMLTIGQYVSFAITFLLPFGLVFEMPLAALFLARLDVLHYRTMVRGRKAAIVSVVVISAALIPTPDIMTVMIMAGPMYLLYELSAEIVRLVEWQRRRRRRREEMAGAGDGIAACAGK